jgi:Lrp/AsnC family transcriptional regulator, regulator for asnA, asnC and gidA
MKIDDTDKKILNCLLDDSKLSFRKVADKANVSAVTVLKRVKELEKEKIIKSYTTELDYQKLGYDVTVIIKMKISKGKLFEVEKKIAADIHVFAVYDITGDFDSVVLARFKNIKSLDSFLKRIQTYDFIEKTETNVVLNTIKEGNVKIE